VGLKPALLLALLGRPDAALALNEEVLHGTVLGTAFRETID